MEVVKPILVTGVAGFVGFHLAQQLLDMGRSVVGIDNLNPYYDVELKKARLANLKASAGFRFQLLNLTDRLHLASLFEQERFDLVLHMAAQAGVQYSLTHPHTYVESNLEGFVNVLEACRQIRVQHFVFASSSSVYGANTRQPFSEHHGVDHPVSLYAATKRANELIGHVYAHLYGLPCTALRFFTVYGPWGRPDMALFLFTKAILEGRPIEIFNHGRMRRDFTYIDDVSAIVTRILLCPATSRQVDVDTVMDPAVGEAPFRIYNIGGHHPVDVMECISILEEALGKKAITQFAKIRPGDMLSTYADITDAQRDFDYSPHTPATVGIPRFVNWYKTYYQIT